MSKPRASAVLDDRREHAELLRALQADLIRYLRRVERLTADVRDAAPVEAEAGTPTVDLLQRHIHSVETLELRMAVVAPMKAGKSTLINAIIGRDLLPNRAMAMTALPTEIELVDELDEPLLELSPAAHALMEKAAYEIQRRFKREPDVRVELKSHSPHLEELIRRIAARGGAAIKRKATGVESVRAALEDLNDLARIGARLDLKHNVLVQLPDVPRVRTPTWGLPGGPLVDMGRLVLVDTPGPDEAATGLDLAPIVQAELAACAVVLVVLNFTTLTNEAVEKIKALVAPVRQLVLPERLYVVVNKVDERRRGDMKPEQLIEFVQHDLELAHASDGCRIFETAARRALIARQYRWEATRCEGDPRALPAAEDLMRELHTDFWEEELEAATPEDLTEAARRAWSRSQVPDFIVQAVDALRVDATPQVLESALHFGWQSTRQLREALELGRRAFDADAATVGREVESLQQNRRDVDRLRKRATSIDQAAKTLQKDVSSRIARARREADELVGQAVMDAFQDDEDDGSSLVGGVLKLFTGSDEPADVVREFSNRELAEEFATRYANRVRDGAAHLLARTRKDIERALVVQARALEGLLRKDVEPVIETARERLSDAFDVRPSFPDPELEIELGGPPPVEVEQTVRESTRIRRRQRDRRLWWTFWLVSKTEEVEVPVVIKREIFCLSRDAAFDCQVSHLRSLLGDLEEQVFDYVASEFSEAANEYLDQVDAYLARYQAQLEDALANQERSADEVRERAQRLRHLEETAVELVGAGRRYAERLEGSKGAWATG